MAKIPVAIGTEQITKQPLAVRQTEGVFSTAVAQASQELAQSVANVTRAFEEAQTLAEKTKADTEATRRLAELQLEAETTEDIWNIQEFKNRIGKIREETTKTITLPQAKNEFNRSFDRDSTLAEFNIRKTLRSRQIDATIVDINENISTLRESFITGDNNTRQVAKTKRDILLTDAVNRGIITAESARKTREETTREWQLAKIDADIESDAEFALEQLQLGEKGIYTDVDAKDRLPKQATANEKINRDMRIAERRLSLNYENSENALAARIFEGQATIREINEAELQGTVGLEGGISTSFATVARRALESVKAVAAVDEIKTYGELSRDFYKLGIEKITDISNAPFEQIAGFRAKVMQKHSDGLITAATANNWIKLVTGSYNAATKEIVQSKFRKGKIVNGWIVLGSKKLPEEEQLEAFRFMDSKLTNRLLREDIPENMIDDVAREILKDFIRTTNPQILDLPEKKEKPEGTLMIDAFGNKARVFSDGTIIEVK